MNKFFLTTAKPSHIHKKKCLCRNIYPVALEFSFESRSHMQERGHLLTPPHSPATPPHPTPVPPPATPTHTRAISKSLSVRRGCVCLTQIGTQITDIDIPEDYALTHPSISPTYFVLSTFDTCQVTLGR